MQFVTITTAQALYAALGMSALASILAVVLTLMAFVYITGRWDDRGECTCHDVWDTEGTGRLRFKCSECGCVSLEITPRYCPCCGAEVVFNDRD